MCGIQVRDIGSKLIMRLISRSLLLKHAKKSISGDSNVDPWLEQIVTLILRLRAMQLITKRLISFSSAELQESAF